MRCAHCTSMETIKVKNKIYTGVGSRETPQNILSLMTRIARAFDRLGWCLYTGGAEGADEAFMAGSTNMQVFLPWQGYRNSNSPYVHDFTSPRGQLAEMAVETYHPAPKRLGAAPRLLIARNTYQVTGWNQSEADLTDILICWTPDGMASGGTGQAIRIADDLVVPVINLHDPVNVSAYQQFAYSVIGHELPT